MWQRTMAAGLLVVVGALLGWVSAAQAAGSITLYTAGLQANAAPSQMAEGPEGNLWFTDGNAAIGRITPAGAITEFTAGLNPGSAPYGITAGPDGNLWFTDFSEGTLAIGRITPSGTITEFSEAHWEDGEPAELTEPLFIVAGPDGNLWFCDYSFIGANPAIGRITPSGTITLYRLPAYSQPRSVVVGPDGNLWFTNWGKSPFHQSIGKITPSGAVTEYLVPERWPEDIVSGPGGALWFTDVRGAIGKITTSGTITEFSAGLRANSHPREIIDGPDGNLWFTDTNGDSNGAIGRITPAGAIAEYGHGDPQSLTVGPDGNIWAGDEGGSVVRVTPSGQFTSFWLGLGENDRPGAVISGPGNADLWFTATGYENGGTTGAIGKLAPVSASTTPTPTVEVDITEPAGGMVTSSPGGISCPGICSSQFAPGTVVTLTATTTSGWSVFPTFLESRGEELCPSSEVPAASSTCTFTVGGDARWEVGFSPGEPGGGSEPAPVGGAAGGGGQGGAAPLPSPSQVPVLPSKPVVKVKALTCRKGFKKQKVHGKAKCVAIKKKRHRH
jgi:streptogramin lyase